MAFIEYTSDSPPYWLDCHVNDRRIALGEYTYFDTQITFGLWQPEDKIRIGKFCLLCDR